jgi:hypothetical protein
MTPQQEAAALGNFVPAYDRLGSGSVIRRCRPNVRFPRKRIRPGRFMSTRPNARGRPAVPSAHN